MRSGPTGTWKGQIGIASADITPPIGIRARSWGSALHDVSTGVHRPLQATMLTIKSDSDLVLGLVSLDLGWWRSGETEAYVREKVLAHFGWKEAQLWISLTHTHSGPTLSLDEQLLPGGNLIRPYLDELADKIISGITEALATSKPRSLRWKRGCCGGVFNRDMKVGDRFVIAGDAGRPDQGSIRLGCVTNEDERLEALIVHFACHPTILGPGNQLISPDFVGAMRESLDSSPEAAGATVAFLQGASGDLSVIDQYVSDPAVADRFGRSVGYGVLSALANDQIGCKWELDRIEESGATLGIFRRAPGRCDSNLESAILEVTLKLKPIPSVKDLDAQLEGCPEPFTRERLVRLRSLRRSLGDGAETTLHVLIWHIGEAILIGVPGEAFQELQIWADQRWPDREVLVVNVVNGWFGYLPPQGEYGKDTYPVLQTPFARVSAETLREALVGAIDHE